MDTRLNKVTLRQGKKHKNLNGYFLIIFCNNFIKKHPMTGYKKNKKFYKNQDIYWKNFRFFVMFYHKKKLFSKSAHKSTYIKLERF